MNMRVFFALWCLVGIACPANAQGFPRNVPGITVTGRATLLAHADVMYVSAALAHAPGAADDGDGAGAAIAAAFEHVPARPTPSTPMRVLWTERPVRDAS